MSLIVSQLWHDGLWLAVAMLCVAAGIGAIALAIAGIQRLAEHWLARGLTEVTEGLPDHVPGPLRADAAACRRLHRDLALLLATTDHTDA